MQVIEYNQIDSLTTSTHAIAIGVFDALHRGHQRVLNKTVALAKGEGAVLTFKNNPAAIFDCDGYQGDVLNLQQKISYFRKMGFKRLILIDFSLEFSKLSGEQFIGQLIKINGLKHIVTGSDFKCGYKGELSIHQIKQMVKHHGVKTTIMPLKRGGRRKISSSLIRLLIIKGRIKQVNHYLGHFWKLEVPRTNQWLKVDDIDYLASQPTWKPLLRSLKNEVKLPLWILEVKRSQFQQLIPQKGLFSANFDANRVDFSLNNLACLIGDSHLVVAFNKETVRMICHFHTELNRIILTKNLKEKDDGDDSRKKRGNH